MDGINMTFDDLNGDNKNEELRTGSFNGVQLFCEVRSIKGKVHGQWNGLYNHVSGTPVICGDFDNDKLKEIYTFSYQGDSVYLNIIEFFDSDGIERKGVFIDIAPLTNNLPGYFIYFAGMFDGNGDGFQELYFSIRNGFKLYPRKLYRYDVKNNTLINTPSYGSIIDSNIQICDITGDGHPEIIGHNSAVNNFPDSVNVKYKDNSAWLFMFDKDLNLVFSPVEYKLPQSIINPFFYFSLKDTLIAAFFNNTGTKNKIYPRLDLYDEKGTLKNVIFDESLTKNKLGVYSLKFDNNHIGFQFFRDNIIYSLNKNIKIQRLAKIPESWNGFNYRNSLEFRDKEFFIEFDNLKQNIILVNSKFKEVCSIHFSEITIEIGEPQVIEKDNSQIKFYSQFSKDSWLTINVKYNGFRFRIVGIILIIYFIISFLLYTSQIFIKRQLNQKQQTLQQLTKFQMLSIKNQLDPHFAFNTVNTLGSLIYSGDKQKAYDYLLQFSNLLREQLTSSDKLLVSLEQEVNATKDYLMLQTQRFGDKLEYNISISTETDLSNLVPRLCIQTYVENAIKHGLKHKEEKGIVNIFINTEKNNLFIEIKDNGIGRKKAKEKRTVSTGKGIRSMSELYTYLNNFSKQKIQFEIVDLYDENKNPSGTLVKLVIPNALKEE